MKRGAHTVFRSVSLAGGLAALVVLAACGGEPVNTGPAVGLSDMSRDQHDQNSMAGCMQYASETYCSRHIYGK